MDIVSYHIFSRGDLNLGESDDAFRDKGLQGRTGHVVHVCMKVGSVSNQYNTVWEFRGSVVWNCFFAVLVLPLLYTLRCLSATGVRRSYCTR